MINDVIDDVSIYILGVHRVWTGKR